jgi:hypothetical protein
MWRKLTSSNLREFQLWARKNYVTGEPISHTWHPVVQLECMIMNMELVTLPNEMKWIMDNLREALRNI